MPLTLHPNDNAREGKPGIWIFQGRTMVLLVVAVVLFVAIFRICDAAGLDWFFSLVVSVLPLCGITLFVHLLINGKPPSYAFDLFLWGVWRLRAWLYRMGVLDRPPQFWVKEPRVLPSPNRFIGKEVA